MKINSLQEGSGVEVAFRAEGTVHWRDLLGSFYH